MNSDDRYLQEPIGYTVNDEYIEIIYSDKTLNHKIYKDLETHKRNLII